MPIFQRRDSRCTTRSFFNSDSMKPDSQRDGQRTGRSGVEQPAGGQRKRRRLPLRPPPSPVVIVVSSPITWSQPDTTSPPPCLPQETHSPWAPSCKHDCVSSPPGKSMQGADICPPIQPPTHEHGSGTIQTASVQVPALPLTSSVSSMTSRSSSFFICKRGRSPPHRLKELNI